MSGIVATRGVVLTRPSREPPVLTVYVDADACPVRDEVYRVAKRYSLQVRVVADRYVDVPRTPLVRAVLVDRGEDAVDDCIVERVGVGDIVVTTDIPLAARCLDSGARVLDHKGREFTENSIGDALASRTLSRELREMGVMTGGPAPLSKKDRSRFLSRLDEIVNAIKRW